MYISFESKIAIGSEDAPTSSRRTEGGGKETLPTAAEVEGAPHFYSCSLALFADSFSHFEEGLFILRVFGLWNRVACGVWRILFSKLRGTLNSCPL